MANDKIYAIGDIHGMYDSLMELMAKIPDDAFVVFLGDYVDRGPDSKKVLDYVLNRENSVRCLGNHDEMFIGYFSDKMSEIKDIPNYVGYDNSYGKETFKSFGYDEELMAEYAVKLHQKTVLYYVTDTHFFSHSGGNPSKSIVEQTRDDLLWFRSPNKKKDYAIDGRYTVHGHTPVNKPFMSENRLDIDTGACFGGKLTCAVFDTSIENARQPIEFIQV